MKNIDYSLDICFNLVKEKKIKKVDIIIELEKK